MRNKFFQLRRRIGIIDTLSISCVLTLISTTVIAQSTDKANRTNNNKGEAEVQSISPTASTRVLISDQHGGGYYDEAQTSDAEIKITATVKGTKDQTVYFEVIDPDDPAPYETNTDANDNRDSQKKGSIPYATFQANSLSARSVTLGGANSQLISEGMYKVWTMLKITNKHAGDNYQINATGKKPKLDQLYSAQPELQGKYVSSGLLTAWKRIYLEIDRMYKKGATITANFTPDTNNDPDTLSVSDTGDFANNAEILIYSRNNISIETTILSVDNTAKTVTVPDIALPTGFAVLPKYAGIKLKNDDTTYPSSLALLSAAFGDAFVEVNTTKLTSWNTPRYDQFPTPNGPEESAYGTRWFRATDKRNVIQLIESHDESDGRTGRAFPADNISLVHHRFLSANGISELEVHELGHHFGIVTSQVAHADEVTNQPNWDNSDNCVMTYGSADGTIGNNRNNGIAKFDLICLYKIRDAADPNAIE